MKRRLLDYYHIAIAMVLMSRTLFIEALCPDCKFDKETGATDLCVKHHEKVFDLDGRALEHYDKIL